MTINENHKNESNTITVKVNQGPSVSQKRPLLEFFENGQQLIDTWEPSVRQLLALRDELKKELRKAEEKLDKHDNPCKCGQPSTHMQRVKYYPQDYLFTRTAGGKWTLAAEFGWGEGEWGEGIYQCRGCYKKETGLLVA
jgi:hypothetical protein